MTLKQLYTGHIITIIGIVIATSGCGSHTETTETATETKTPITITRIAVKPITEAIGFNAVSSFMRKNIVKASATSLIVNSFINLGDYIEKDQVIYILKTKEAVAFEKSTVTDTSLTFKGEVKIKAQKSGVVTTITHQKGDYVQEGDELAQVAEQNSLMFILQAPFELVNYIKLNQKCDIHLSDKQIITGVISKKLPVMDTQSQTENFVVEPLGENKFPENLMVRIYILKSTIKNANVLPKEAVLTDETLTSFWVMKLINDSTVIKIPIKKGIEVNGEVEILEPTFSETDRIVYTGNYGLGDTAKVSIIK